jgi:inosose dehydratase
MLDSSKIRLGIAPIGWTNDDLPEMGAENTFEQCISEMALAGFTGTEIGNKYPRDGKVLKKALELRGMSICNAWFSTFFTSKDEKETIDAFVEHRDFLYEQGARVIGCSEQGNSIQGRPVPIFKEKPVYTETEWKKVTGGMNVLGELAAEKGMKVCLHHHMGTGVQTPEEIDRFMDTVSRDVYLLYDSGHLVFSEGDVEPALGVLKKHIGRVAHIHLKDMRPEVYRQAVANDWSFLESVKNGVFTVPGDGMIDFRALFDIVERSEYEGWMLVEAEQDPAKANPFEYAKMAREYIRKAGGI